MYRKIVWCYIIVLTLLDIPLNSKLSAQGKSHGNGESVHESLVEGYSLQDWGKEPTEEEDGASIGRGRAIPEGALQLSPARLAFGRAALAAPHVLTVTITNTANETIHLASVAGTTPDFHSSFFDSKTLAPQANTSFSVVYLGRREGPVAAYLYIHTSKGIYKYPVSAVGVASAYRVWPLVGLRVPHNATLEPTLTLYNPTDATIQVREVYSSGAWVRLALVGGGAGAAWAVPPHEERALVALRLRPPDPAGATAYVRVRWGRGAAALVVGVEARAAPPGEYLQPAAVRLAVRGSRDPPDRFPLAAGNSAPLPVALSAAVGGAACAPLADPTPGAAAARANGRAGAGAGAAGVGEGAEVSLLRGELPPHAPPLAAATLTLHYDKLWATAGAGAGAGEGARCAGWARVGRAAAPYSLTLLPGTLALQPPQLHFVTGEAARALEPREVRAHNQFPVPLRVHRLHFPDELLPHFHIEELAPLVVAGGARAALARLRLRPGAAAAAAELAADILVHTNVTDYRLPLLLYSGTLHIEWDWPADSWSADELDVGVVSVGGTVEITGRVTGGGGAAGGGAALRAHASLPGGAAELKLDPENPGVVRLLVAAPAAAGAARGALELRAPLAHARRALTLHALPGALALLPPHMPPAAPYVWSSAPLVVESSMALRMRVADVSQPPDARDAALSVTVEEGAEVRAGRVVVGRVQYAPELACRPHCYTGLDPASAEGAAWAARGGAAAALGEDAQAARARRARQPARAWRGALRLATAGVRRAGGEVRVAPLWPRLARRAAAAPRAAVALAAPFSLTVANPSHHPLLVQPVLHPHAVALGEEEEEECAGCVWCATSFSVGEWRATRGRLEPWGAAPQAGAPYVLLSPRAEAELALAFTPRDAAPLATYLYIRNNLTIVEKVLLSGVGAHPIFELGGRKPNSTSPLLVEVTECGADGDAGTAGRTLTVRNTGHVPLRLRGWRIAGVPCGARGFRLQPCAAVALQPNESRSLHLAFAADWTRARVAAVLTVRAGARLAAFHLAGAVPARALARCAPAARRAPFEPALRALGAALALLALAGAAALAAADAERALRRHRAARAAPPPPRAPLDLRALARPAPPAPAALAPRRRRTPRRRAPPQLDPAAERRAFERWRAEVERRDPAAAPLHPEDSPSRSPSDDEGDGAAPSPPPPLAARRPREDTSSSSPDSSPPPPDSYSMSSRLDDAEEEEDEEEEMEEGASTVSETSSGGDERSEGDAPATTPAPPPPPASPPRPHPATCLDPLCSHHDATRRAARGPPTPRATQRPAPRRPRRRERPASPPRAAARASPRPGAPPAPVRWGTATWSSVVSRGPEAPRAAPPPPAPRAPPPPPADPAPAPPLAPIGSDVRRRLGSHSLFFYSGEAGAARWPPGEERPAEARWGAGEGPAAAWSWGAGGGGAVRPPPGFAPRVYDPFHSLASIWTPAALDWRADPPTPPLDDKFDPTVPPPPLPSDRSGN